MRLTLLRMVQLIASSMDSDEVQDIDDSVESRQITDIIEQVYNDLCATIDFPENWDLFELEPSLDPSRPTIMYVPERVAKVEWIQYDHSEENSTDRNWRYVFPLSRGQFFNRMNALDSDRTEVYRYDYLVGTETFDIRGWNDRPPAYYTTVDNRTLIFDNFDAAQGQTLVGNRTMGYGMIIPAFVRDNDFIAPFEPRQFTLFFNEAKAQCFVELKQVQNAKAERNARRGWNMSQRKKNVTDASTIRPGLPNFGRRSRKPGIIRSTRSY